MLLTRPVPLRLGATMLAVTLTLPSFCGVVVVVRYSSPLSATGSASAYRFVRTSAGMLITVRVVSAEACAGARSAAADSTAPAQASERDAQRLRRRRSPRRPSRTSGRSSRVAGQDGASDARRARRLFI